MNGNCCEECIYYAYDEEYEEYYCTVEMDEDDYARMSYDSHSGCAHFTRGDEYTIVRKQM